jgi:asparagine synthase (glutamine-hydrolysing)
VCGIAGVLGANLDGALESGRVERMNRTLVHRGPDGGGVWASPDGRAVFGHRRLSIVDLSEHGHQPMCNEDETVWITFNGEVYNSPELRDTLLGKGHEFDSHSDTECIVHLYEERGSECLDQLDGDYAFAIHDTRAGETVLARDRLGVKPLYYAWHEGKLLFASEIKAILAYPGFVVDVDEQALYHYLTFLVTPAPSTMFKGVSKLEPGHRAFFGMDGQLRVERWWDSISTDRNGATESENIGEIRRLLRDSISKRMMSDVPFGVFLSGGVDSSTNVALMAELMDRPVDTYSVAFEEDPEFNELNHARDIAKRYGANHNEVIINWNDLVDFLPDLIFHQDEPLADPVCVPLNYVARLAKNSGTTVVQVGEGADEIFCGYTGYMRFLDGYKREWRALNAIPKPLLGGLAGPVTSFLQRRNHGQRADVVRRASAGEEFFWGGAVVFSEDEKRRIAPSISRRAESSAKVVDRIYAEIDRRRPEADVLERMTYLELHQRLPELLLMRVDKMAMATSVEARVPFLDHELVEFAAGLSLAQKTRGGMPKYLLKKAVEGIIPDEIIYRRKQGFGVPISNWFRGDLGEIFRQALTGSSIGERGLIDVQEALRLLDGHRRGEENSFKLWVLLNLILWYDRWIVGREISL